MNYIGGFTCPEGKETNPFYVLHKQQVVDGHRLKVRKCLKVCPELYVRDPEFGRCKSTRPRGRPKNPCKEGKERNPVSKRCVKKCVPPLIRSLSSGNCVTGRSRAKQRGGGKLPLTKWNAIKKVLEEVNQVFTMGEKIDPELSEEMIDQYSGVSEAIINSTEESEGYLGTSHDKMAPEDVDLLYSELSSLGETIEDMINLLENNKGEQSLIRSYKKILPKVLNQAKIVKEYAFDD